MSEIKEKEKIEECYKIDFWKSFGNVILNDKIKDGGTTFNTFYEEIENNTNIFYINEKDEKIKKYIFNLSNKLNDIINYNKEDKKYDLNIKHMIDYFYSFNNNILINFISRYIDLENHDNVISNIIIFLYYNVYLNDNIDKIDNKIDNNIE